MLAVASHERHFADCRSVRHGDDEPGYRTDLHVRVREHVEPGAEVAGAGARSALVAPAVDLTVLGLLVGTRHLAMSGASDAALRPARHLLVAASAVTYC